MPMTTGLINSDDQSVSRSALAQSVFVVGVLAKYPQRIGLFEIRISNQCSSKRASTCAWGSGLCQSHLGVISGANALFDRLDDYSISFDRFVTAETFQLRVIQ